MSVTNFEAFLINCCLIVRKYCGFEGKAVTCHTREIIWFCVFKKIEDIRTFETSMSTTSYFF